MSWERSSAPRNCDDGVDTLGVGTIDGNALTVNLSFGDSASFDVDVCAFVGSAIG